MFINVFYGSGIEELRGIQRMITQISTLGIFRHTNMEDREVNKLQANIRLFPTMEKNIFAL